MSVYLVTWDLNKEGPAYRTASERLHDRLDTLATIKHPGLRTVRFVDTTRSAKELYEYLENFVDADDKIVINKLSLNSYWGTVSKEVWEWVALRL